MEWEGVQKKNAEDSKMSSVGMFFKMFSGGGGGQKQIQKRTNIICKFFFFQNLSLNRKILKLGCKTNWWCLVLANNSQMNNVTKKIA